MNVIPWRTRVLLSGHFSLFHHLAANLFRKRSGADYWDQNLPDSFASEISRIMRPGGQAFVPNDCLGPIDAPEHVVKCKPSTLADFFSRHFDEVSAEAIQDGNFPMPVLVGHARKHCARANTR